MKNIWKKCLGLIFVGYIGLCLYLLLFSRGKQGYYDYNLLPFEMVRRFYIIITTYPSNYLIYAWNNLFGNVLLFVPMGLFMPILFERYQKFPRFLLAFVSFITCIEIIQFISQLGTGDIDDILLNTLGAVIGFFLYKLARKI